MVETKNQPRIVRGRIELWVPHNSGERAFAYPAVRGPYIGAGKTILDNNQEVPTGDYTASLLYPAYCKNSVADEPEFKEVKDIMKRNCLWVFNRVLWTDKGAYVFPDKEAIGRSQPLDIKNLEKMLKGGKEIDGIILGNDSIVRFAPKGSYNFGENTPETFAKDGFIIASCGKEGAEKLGEVSTKFKDKPYIYGLDINEGQAPEQRVSAVNENDDRLRFDGDDWSDYSDSHAFGVLK